MEKKNILIWVVTSLFLFLFVFFSVKTTVAQTYRSAELLEIGELLDKSNKNYNYEIRTTDNGSFERIIHLGIPIFKKEAKQVFSPMVYDFVERYSLYLRLLDENSRKSIIRDNKLNVCPDDLFMVDSLCNFTIEQSDSKYRIVWTKDSAQICEFSFPKNFKLISGLDASENQEFFFSEVLKYSPDTTKKDFCYSNLNFEDKDDYLVLKSNTYYIEQMKSDLYFDKSDSLPINDLNYPIETLANIFGGLVESDCVLKIKHSLYNYKIVTYEIEISKLINYCLSQKCKFYMGIEKYDEQTENIVATIIYENKELNYNHLLRLDFAANQLFWGNKVIDAELITYIPTHNLKDLYNDDKE